MKPEPLPSNRSFGVLFVCVFAILAGYTWWRGHTTAALWLAGALLAFAAVTLLHDAWLTPLNRAWMGLAMVLNRIVSPIVLGIMYYGLVTPYGIVMRLAGRDPMRRRFDPRAKSYWLAREPPGPPPDSLRKQF